jgi:hypothetical protein
VTTRRRAEAGAITFRTLHRWQSAAGVDGASDAFELP